MSETLYASFADPTQAERAVGALLDHGVRHEDVSFIAGEAYGKTRLSAGATATPAAPAAGEVNPVRAAEEGISTTTPADAASGAVSGAGIGLGIGALAALASLFIPGVGLVTGGGALAAALSAAGATTAAGAVAGGVTGYLKDQGMPDMATEHYGKAVEQGGAVIAVRLPSGKVERAEAEEVISKYQAANLNAFEVPLV